MKMSFELLESRTLLSSAFVTVTDIPRLGDFVAADFDGDGDIDLAGGPDQTGSTTAFDVGVYLNQGNGTFTLGANYDNVPQAPGFPPAPAAAADFDGDGDVDLIHFGRFFRNNGNATFAPAENIAGLTGATPPRALNYDSDGRADVAVIDLTGTFKILLGGGANFAEVATNITGLSFFAPVFTGDINGDGDDDVVAYNIDTAEVRVIQKIAPAIWAVTSITLGNKGLAVADADNDGRLDLISVNAQGAIIVAAQASDGTFGVPQVTAGGPGVFVYTGLVDAADFDGDGRADLVVSSTQGGVDTYVIAWNPLGSPFGVRSNAIATDDSTRDVFGFRHANIVGDSKPEVLFSDVHFTPTESAYVRTRRLASGPAIAAFQGPTGPLAPGTHLIFTATGVTPTQFTSGTVTAVEVFRDTNGNGVYDSGVDLLFATLTNNNGTWQSDTVLVDGALPAGANKFFAVARDSFTTSDAVAFDVAVWTRSYYAEGWRNDASVNEYLPLVNPNDVTVSYRVIARYETGVRDQVIASGDIPARSRGGITISERGFANLALVRANVGYALEVQSSLAIGAMLSHYDNFGINPQDATATGEALTTLASTVWNFADLSTSRFDYLLFYNPYENDITVTTTFFLPGGGSTDVAFTLAGFRRGGLSLRDLPQLAPVSAFAAKVVATGAVVASQTSYAPATGEGFTALGQIGHANAAEAHSFVITGLEHRTGVSNVISMFNPGLTPLQVTVDFTFDNGAPVQHSLTIAPKDRASLNTGLFATAGAGFVTARLNATAEFFAQAQTSDVARTDSTSTTAGVYAADGWLFADAFLDRTLAGTQFFETLSVYNPNATDTTIMVKSLFSDGTSVDRTVTIGAGRTASLLVHNDTSITARAPATWFSISVTGTQRTVATFTHWDLLQGGGWTTQGTPVGTVMNLQGAIITN